MSKSSTMSEEAWRRTHKRLICYWIKYSSKLAAHIESKKIKHRRSFSLCVFTGFVPQKSVDMERRYSN